MIEISVGGTAVIADDSGILKEIHAGGVCWEFEGCGAAEYGGRQVCFSDAKQISAQVFSNGAGRGLSVRYGQDEAFPLSFETRTWIEYSTGDIFFEWIPLGGCGAADRVCWPPAFRFREKKASWYTLLPLRQGLRIPNGWPHALRTLPFDGMFLTAGCYMPWFAQVRDGCGYIAVSVTPWDAGVKAVHAAGENVTVQQWLMPSMGEMGYRRIIRYTFLEHADEAAVTAVYRRYVRESGKLVTLREKAVRNPKVEALIGSSFVHFGIKAVIQPESRFYDAVHPEKNAALVSFAKRADMIRGLAAAGAGKMYLHLDGWAEPGYDNCHPDYGPACEAAGGWEGMRLLAGTLHECGGMFGIHDQYRDYYRRAPSFDPGYAVMEKDGNIFEQAVWAGGSQSYLCASQALYYVRRNFRNIRENGVTLDGAYLDVFTCNEADECWNPRHRMTRRECLSYRSECFSWLSAQGIMPSSEEVSDWAMRDMVFTHYAPYEEQMAAPGTPKQGIPVPLFSLVYHDCVIVPWMMERDGERDNMLYALLNAGAPYLVREGAYPDTDGAFGGGRISVEDAVSRCRTVAGLHERCGMAQMTGFSLGNEEGTKQRTEFADGTVVAADLEEGTYRIG